MNVVGLSLATPLGLSAAATQRACAAGISRAEVLEQVPRRPTAVRLATLPELLNREDRMLALVGHNVQALMAALPAGHEAKIRCHLAVPASGPTFARDRWLAGLLRVAGLARLEVHRDRCVEAGRVGFFQALRDAYAGITDVRGPAYAVVGAVDSLVDPASLASLAEAGLLLDGHNPDGVIPGEAAGFVVLANTAAVAGRRAEVQARLAALAFARDPVPADERTPYAAVGLTAVFRELRGHPAVGDRRVDRVLTCQPGASFWAHEFAAAYLRTAGMMPEPLDHRGLAGSLGDVGCAAGVCQLALALHAFAPAPWRHVAALRRIVVYAAAEHDCAGCLLVHPKEAA